MFHFVGVNVVNNMFSMSCSERVYGMSHFEGNKLGIFNNVSICRGSLNFLVLLTWLALLAQSV